MLNKNKSKKQSVLKMGFVLPFLAIALLTLNTKTIAQTKSVTAEINTQKIELQITAETTDEELAALQEIAKRNKIDLKFENIKRNNINRIVSISSSYSSAEGSSGSKNSIGDIPISPFYFFLTKNNLDNIMAIGYMSISQEEIVEKKYISANSTSEMIRETGELSEDVLVVVNGQEMDASYDLDKLNPNTISSISVLKGEGAEKKYGTKGEHGVVIITSKDIEVNVQTDPSKTKTITHRIVTDKKPLIVIDGKQMKPSYDMDQIEPDNIKSVNVLKGESAIEKYGKKGKNGVVEITTKK